MQNVSLSQYILVKTIKSLLLNKWSAMSSSDFIIVSISHNSVNSEHHILIWIFKKAY